MFLVGDMKSYLPAVAAGVAVAVVAVVPAVVAAVAVVVAVAAAAVVSAVAYALARDNLGYWRRPAYPNFQVVTEVQEADFDSE